MQTRTKLAVLLLLLAVAGFGAATVAFGVSRSFWFSFAMLLIIGGIFRVVVAISVRFPNSAWMLFHGAVNLLLGVSILQDWPLSGLWVIGLFVGIDMIFNGWSLVMLGFAARRLPNAD